MVVEKHREALARAGELGAMTLEGFAQRGRRLIDVVAHVGGAIVDQRRQSISGRRQLRFALGEEAFEVVVGRVESRAGDRDMVSEQIRHLLATRGELRIVGREQLLHLQPGGLESGPGLAGARQHGVGDTFGEISELSLTLGEHQFDLRRRGGEGRAGGAALSSIARTRPLPKPERSSRRVSKIAVSSA